MKQSAKLSIDLITTIIVTLIAGAVTVAAVISMAWFASNKEVGTNGSSVTVDAELFELGVNACSEAQSEVLTILNTDGYNNDLFETTSAKSGIICDLIIESYYKGELETAIRPGSYGKLIFRIIPKKDNLVFRADWSLAGFRQTGVEEGVDRFEFVDGNNENDKVIKAYKLLNGHILMFTTRTEEMVYSGQVNNDIIYSGDDADSGIYITGASEKGKVYEVTLYWNWIRTYDEIKALLGTTEVQSGEEPDIHTETIYKVDDPQTYEFLYDGEAVDQDGETILKITGTEGYNNGDQTIGDIIKYVVAEISVETYTGSLEGITPTEATEVSE